MGDLDTLVELGFDKERAQLALKHTGSLNDAIDWIEKNQDKDIDTVKAESSAAAEASSELPAAGLEAKSYVCNECGKRFRGMPQVQWHGNKSGHEDFSESAEEIAPLTEEEKAAQLALLKEKAAARKAAAAEEEKKRNKENEKIRMKNTKENQDRIEQLKVQERLKEAAQKRKEKKDEEDARKRVLAQIQRDREARKEKAEAEKRAREGGALYVEPSASTPAPPAAPAASSKKAADYKETRLRLQTPNGTVQKNFPVETTLFEVAHALAAENGTQVSTFTQNFPRKTFDNTDFGMTLKEAGLVPSAALIVR